MQGISEASVPTCESIAESPRPRKGSVQTAQNHRLDGDLWIEVAISASDFAGRENLWDDLVENAAEPNTFFERWFLDPAIRAFGEGRDLAILFVYRKSRREDFPPALVGLFPFERVRGHVTSRLTLFSHPYAFLLDPLIRKGHEVEAWRTVLDWAYRDGSIDVLDLPLMRGEGRTAQAIAETLHQRSAVSTTSSHVRALLRVTTSADEYTAESLTSKQRHEFARQFRRLSETGQIEIRQLQARKDVTEWALAFLRLESGGWKGKEQTALDATNASRRFFGELMQGAAARNRLHALGMFRDGFPVAMKINFLCPPGSFSFKIAYNESLSKFSPGVQLELENIRAMHDAPGVQWMDSCASADHPMINRLWRERTIIQHHLISTGTVRGNLSVGLRPAFRAARRLLSRPSAHSKSISPPNTGPTP
jgi:CelD/BcsL family acetyltransferase involved in cellulose biosynthesis